MENNENERVDSYVGVKDWIGWDPYDPIKLGHRVTFFMRS